METKRYMYKDISMIFGLLSIYFAFFISLTGILMGIISIYYERKDMKINHKLTFDRLNAAIIILGMLLSITIFIKEIISLFR